MNITTVSRGRRTDSFSKGTRFCDPWKRVSLPLTFYRVTCPGASCQVTLKMCTLAGVVLGSSRPIRSLCSIFDGSNLLSIKGAQTQEI